jgi:hypothetical protein
VAYSTVGLLEGGWSPERSVARDRIVKALGALETERKGGA